MNNNTHFKYNEWFSLINFVVISLYFVFLTIYLKVKFSQVSCETLIAKIFTFNYISAEKQNKNNYKYNNDDLSLVYKKFVHCSIAAGMPYASIDTSIFFVLLLLRCSLTLISNLYMQIIWWLHSLLYPDYKYLD